MPASTPALHARSALRATRRSLVWLACLACVACSTSSSTPVLVLAASSLHEAAPALKESFEADQSGHEVRFSLAGTQALRLQIEHGVQADVLLAASHDHVAALVEQGLVEDRGSFARNEVVLVVPQASEIERFEQLPSAQRLVLGANTVPIGAYTQAILRNAERVHGRAFRSSVEARVVSREASVRLVRTKVVLGEADAAFVYRSDTVGIEGLRVIPLPAEIAVHPSFPAARVLAGTHPRAAEAFIQLVKGDTGRVILGRHGFAPP